VPRERLHQLLRLCGSERQCRRIRRKLAHLLEEHGGRSLHAREPAAQLREQRAAGDGRPGREQVEHADGKLVLHAAAPRLRGCGERPGAATLRIASVEKVHIHVQQLQHHLGLPRGRRDVQRCAASCIGRGAWGARAQEQVRRLE